MDRISVGELGSLSVFDAGRWVFVIISADSAHCKFNRYGTAENSGYGHICQKMTIKQNGLVPT